MNCVTPLPGRVRFGTFEFDPASLELMRQGTRVPLEPQPAKALALLLDHGGHIVSRDSLKQALWNGDVHVDFDRGLAYCIAQVRTALGDTAENPRFIETLPRRGFRFIAPLALQPLPPTPSIPQAQRPRVWALSALAIVALAIIVVTFAMAGKRPLLAVAIFDNETGEPAHDRSTAGMSDALVAHFGTLDPGRIGVIGNARALRMPRSERDLTLIEHETGAQFILLGQLQNHEGGLRLIVHLIRLEDGSHVWVERFDLVTGSLDGVEADVLREAEAGVRRHVMGEWSEPSSPTANR
jgi:DNA-binding winged helix-turn-helix (wHTH) protein/TolB-like protein